MGQTVGPVVETLCRPRGLPGEPEDFRGQEGSP